MKQATIRGIAGSIIATAGLIGLTTPAQAAPQALAEKGFVADCTGVAEGYSATISLYQNSTVDVAPVATVTTPDGTELAGKGTTTGEVFNDGMVDLTFELADLGTHPPAPAGSAGLSGTYTLAGSPARVHQTLRDNGYVIVITGTNTQLSTNLSLEYAGTSIPLTCDPAFAFDLTTRRQPIGNV